jgi:hypothetical protein
VRWKGDELDAVIDAINATAYGLTLGIHSRSDSTIAPIVQRAKVAIATTSIATRSAQSWAFSTVRRRVIPSVHRTVRPRAAPTALPARFVTERTLNGQARPGSERQCVLIDSGE